MKFVTDVPQPKRPWCRFRLKTLLIVVTLFVVVLAIIREPHLAQHRAAAELEATGARISWEGSGPFQNVVTVTFLNHYAEKPPREKFRAVTGDDIALVRHFTQLRTLDLESVPVSDGDMVNLSRLSRLETLDLSSTSITDDGLKHLQNLTNLRHLNIRATKITCDGLHHLSHLPNLTSLTVGSGLKCDSILKRVSQLSGLEDLTVWRGIPESDLVHLGKLPNLKRLHLRPGPLTDVGMGHLSSLPKLETLYIDGMGWLTPEVRAKIEKAMPRCEINEWHEPNSK